MLYGEKPRKILNLSLKLISSSHCLQTEYFLIKLFGWNTIKFQYDKFTEGLNNNLGIRSPSLETRFEIYEEILS